MMEEKTAVRIDKWLKVARFFKQRELAAEAVESGKVRINGEKVKPSRAVIPGDVLTVKQNSAYVKYTVVEVTDRSLPKEKARELYKKHEPEEKRSAEANELIKILDEQDKLNDHDREKGRPTKRDRRILNKYKYMTNG